MGNQIAHFEVGSADFDGLVRFYGELFDWRVERTADTLAIVDTRSGDGVNGAIGKSGDGTPWVSFYVGVDDPGAVLRQAEALGGTVELDVIEIPDLMTFAMFRDPDGSLVGLLETKGGKSYAGQPSTGDGPPVDWFEVLGADAERTQRFYCDLFGWTLEEGSGEPGYRLVQAGGSGIGGGLGGGAGEAWATVYAKVPDAAATLAKAEQLGASRVYGPAQVDDHMRTGAFRDPAGNVFGVYQHADHD
jgi:predicted enzyme related to lactoylglutathione lyase